MVSEVFSVQLLVWKAGPSLEEAVNMLIDVLVGVTNLGKAICCFISGSRNPLERDVICGKLQTPSIDLIISILSIEEMC